MLAEKNSIILVDDSADDLMRISSIFAERGIGCRSFLYDGINFPEEPLTGVRMVFMDINLSNSGDQNSQFAVLSEALQKYVSMENTYFVLVFWTTHVDYIEGFKAFVNRDENTNQLPKPMLVMPLGKDEFIDDDEALEEKLSQIFNEKLTRCLFSFDENIQKAANKCLEEIVSLAPFDDSWGNNTIFETNVRNLFTKIAVDYLGLNPAKANPDKAIMEVITPSFLYDLTEVNQNTWKEFLEMEGKTDVDLQNISFSGDNTSARLNTILNIDPSTEDVEARGSVRNIKTDKDAQQYFENAFTVTMEDFIQKKMVEPKKEGFADVASVVAVELSAACDYSNDKPRLHRYMLGILCKRKDYDDYVSKNKTKQLGDHLMTVPFDIMYNNDVYCMTYNLNYTFNEEKADLFGKLGERIFGLKSDFMNFISDKYAQHISRLGYAYFKKT